MNCLMRIVLFLIAFLSFPVYATSCAALSRDRQLQINEKYDKDITADVQKLDGKYTVIIKAPETIDEKEIDYIYLVPFLLDGLYEETRDNSKEYKEFYYVNVENTERFSENGLSHNVFDSNKLRSGLYYASIWYGNGVFTCSKQVTKWVLLEN